MLKKKIYHVILSVFLLLLAACSSGINVNISNDSGKDLKKIKIIYKDGEKSYEGLKKGQKVKLNFLPQKSSTLSVNVVLETGKKVDTKLDTYFERGYTGDIDIIINKGFNAKIIDNRINH